MTDPNPQPTAAQVRAQARRQPEPDEQCALCSGAVAERAPVYAVVPWHGTDALYDRAVRVCRAHLVVAIDTSIGAGSAKVHRL